MTRSADLLDVPEGLKGVAVAATEVGDVRGDEGLYHYRQYVATDLARTRTFSDVWHLFDSGALPATAAASAEFAAQTAVWRQLPDGLLPGLAAIASVPGTPLDRLRSALSLSAAALGCRPVLDLDPEARRHDARRLAALVPTLAATLYRLGQGLEPLPPEADLGHAAAFLQLATGSTDPLKAGALERYLIATIDHGFNASTFAARVTASTGADMGACLVAGLAALSGPLHGGAPARALDLLDEIGTPERATGVIAAKLAAGERIMGFGHAVYRVEDPRSALLKAIVADLAGPRAALAAAVERAVLDELQQARPDRPLGTNVEFYAGVLLEAVGLPPALFTPAFAVSRVVGWSAHVLEQAEHGRLIRPNARYVGPWPLTAVPA
jgi:citrate synthase